MAYLCIYISPDAWRGEKSIQHSSDSARVMNTSGVFPRCNSRSFNTLAFALRGEMAALNSYPHLPRPPHVRKFARKCARHLIGTRGREREDDLTLALRLAVNFLTRLKASTRQFFARITGTQQYFLTSEKQPFSFLIFFPNFGTANKRIDQSRWFWHNEGRVRLPRQRQRRWLNRLIICIICVSQHQALFGRRDAN